MDADLLPWGTGALVRGESPLAETESANQRPVHEKVGIAAPCYRLGGGRLKSHFEEESHGMAFLFCSGVFR